MPQLSGAKDRVWAQSDARARPWGPALLTTIIAASVLIILFVLYALWGVRAIRKTLIAETERNGIALVESILLASDYSVTTAVLSERLAWENLATRARLAAAKSVNVGKPGELMKIGEADGIVILRDGQVPHIDPPPLADLLHSILDDLTVLAAVEGDEVGSFEFVEPLTGNEWIGAAVPLDDGVLILWEHKSAAENVPAWSGIGLLIREIGQRSEINYIMLQSPDGIVFASRPLPPVLSLADDDFLVDALDDTTAASREIVFEGTPVLEVVKPFLSEDLPSGMFRVGISLTAVFDAEERLTIQLGVSAILFLLLAIVGLSFVVARRSYSDLSRSYQRVETLTQQILNSMDQAVMAVDPQGRMTVFNRAAERLIGRRIDPDKPAAVRETLGTEDYRLTGVAAGGEPVHDQETRLHRGDRPRELVYSTTPVITADGHREGAVTVVRDETESRALAGQIERSKRLSELGNLAAGVAHEIRNPLNAIGLAARRLQSELSDPEAVQLAGTIVDESRRLNAIVEDFLSLARSSAQPKTVLDCAQIVETVGSMAALEAGEKGVSWELRPPLGNTLVLGVADELRKAVWNITTNAIGATPPSGAVTASVERHGNLVRITIEDTGAGINKEDLSRIFEPYFTTRKGGTGLGLAITHRIISDHGGAIRIESPRPGADNGTRVVIELPATEAGPS